MRPDDESRSGDGRAAFARKVARLVRTADVITLVLGAWLVVAPYVVHYADTDGVESFWNDGLVGAALVITALVRLTAPLGALAARAGSLVLGTWLILAPAVLGYVGGSAPKATATEVLVGAVVALLALVTVVAASAAYGTDAGATADKAPPEAGRSETRRRRLGRAKGR